MNYFYQQLKNVYHLLQAVWWRAFFGFPDTALQIYGITGTNGKTTTSYILRGILAKEYGEDQVGMLTTVSFHVGKQERINKTKMTTLQSKTMFRYMREMKRAGVRHVVFELTSHALDQHRAYGIHLDGAIILNVEREHLDYHGTMERYAAAKQKIVRYLKPGAPLAGKQDDPFVRSMLDSARSLSVPVHVFSTHDARRVATPLPGNVNKENVLAATLLARAIGVSEESIAAGVEAVSFVPGRMEWVETGKDFRVLIDYAVTPDALERLYNDVKGMASGRVIAVLGVCGLRDRGKRPLMAQAVAAYADEVIITREDPWTEPEEQIFSDLEQGLAEVEVPWKRIADRKEAIRFALRQARPGDVVVVTGKGAEQGMAIGRKVISWNDKAVITALLQAL